MLSIIIQLHLRYFCTSCGKCAISRESSSFSSCPWVSRWSTWKIQSLQYDQTQKTSSSQTPLWSTASLEKRSCCRGTWSPPFPLFTCSGGSPLLRRGESKDWESQWYITNLWIIVCVKLHINIIYYLKTILTYNCAHLMSTKESLTF